MTKSISEEEREAIVCHFNNCFAPPKQVKYCYDCGYPHQEKFNCPKCGNSLYTDRPNRRTARWEGNNERTNN